MALNLNQLAAAFQAIFEDLDPNATAAGKAMQMAQAVDAYVKTGGITIPSGTTFEEDFSVGIE